MKLLSFRAKASLLDPAAAKNPPMSEPSARSHEAIAPETTAQEMEQTSNKPASPTTEAQDPVPPVKFTEDSPHTATNVQDEVEILGS